MNNDSSRSIDGVPSILLDILRFGAAITVFLVHAINMWFPTKMHDATKPGDLSHAAVVVFFVLSGYVIAYTTTRNNRNYQQYTIARLSRLYSVLIPALIITMISEIAVAIFSPSLYADCSRGMSFPRYILTIFFCNELWFMSAAPPINGPLWSLGYEAFYYLIFGLWMYKGKKWWSFLIPIIGVAIAGPKILSMLPIWILGVLAYKSPTLNISGTLSWLYSLLLLLVFFMVLLVVPPLPGKIGDYPMFFSGQFITDFVIGLFFSLTLWLMPNGKKIEFRNINNSLKYFREIANLTFPIYVLHVPLLFVFRMITEYYKISQISEFVVSTIGVLILSSIVGFYMNRNKRIWDIWIFELFNYFEDKIRLYFQK